MGERQVINRYYPADFDPSSLPRIRRPRDESIFCRMVLPISMRCNTCGNYINKGTEFYTRKVIGEKYSGIQIFRFYFRCTNCGAEITIKTDPRNSDYAVESGARAEDEEESLEKRTLDYEHP